MPVRKERQGASSTQRYLTSPVLPHDPAFCRECFASGQRSSLPNDICGQAIDQPIHDKRGLRNSFRRAKTRSSCAFLRRLGSFDLEERSHKGACDDAHRCVMAICRTGVRTLPLVLDRNRKTPFAKKGYTRVANTYFASRSVLSCSDTLQACQVPNDR